MADIESAIEEEDGFGRCVTVRRPDGAIARMTGLTTDIAQTIDPETGQAVSGRTASVSLPLRKLEGNPTYLGVPKGITDKNGKPWVIEFDDNFGRPQMFRVTESMPDRAAGVVVCHLEFYRAITS